MSQQDSEGESAKERHPAVQGCLLHSSRIGVLHAQDPGAAAILISKKAARDAQLRETAQVLRLHRRQRCTSHYGEYPLLQSVIKGRELGFCFICCQQGCAGWFC